jgi:hypothetical protein
MAKCVLAGLLSLLCLTGCRMCACPYDDCYPVIESDNPQPDTAPPAIDDAAVSSNQGGHSNRHARYATGPQLMRDQ